MQKTRVGVVRGGRSSEYDVSLRTGASVLKHLPQEKYLPVDILLTKNGEWIVNGILIGVESLREYTDVIWNALHGEFGEDGKVQQLFENHGIRYTGSRVLSSAIGMNKQLAKDYFKNLDIRTPTGVVISSSDEVEDGVFTVFRNFALPVVIKPVSGGSSVGVTIAHNYDELMRGVEAAHQHGDVLVEEFIQGREATCVVLDGKDDELYALSPIEIIPKSGHAFFDFAAKYDGASDEICPGNFTQKETAKIRELATLVHKGLGLRHYSRSDFIVSPRGVYTLEVNTLPGLTEASLLPKALDEAGITFSEFLDHVVELAMR